MNSFTPLFSALLYMFPAACILWGILAAYFVATNGVWPRWIFILGHYGISILATATITWALFRIAGTLPNPFQTMILMMGSLFLIELVIFNTVYKGDLSFLNFVDWMVPVFLIATTIYAVAYRMG